jgi:hypothetical protein
MFVQLDILMVPVAHYRISPFRFAALRPWASHQRRKIPWAHVATFRLLDPCELAAFDKRVLRRSGWQSLAS